MQLAKIIGEAQEAFQEKWGDKLNEEARNRNRVRNLESRQGRHSTAIDRLMLLQTSCNEAVLTSAKGIEALLLCSCKGSAVELVG